MFGDFILTDSRESGAGCDPTRSTPATIVHRARRACPARPEVRNLTFPSGGTKTHRPRQRDLECSASTDGSKIVYVGSDASHPSELFFFDLTTQSTAAPDDLNARWLAQVTAFERAESFTVNDHAGFTVHAWIMHPPGALPGRRYPTLLRNPRRPRRPSSVTAFSSSSKCSRHAATTSCSPTHAEASASGMLLPRALAKNWSCADVRR